MAATKATPALPTSRMLQDIDNDQLLKLLKVVSDNVHRRLRNYIQQSAPPVLLDGLRFAERPSQSPVR